MIMFPKVDIKALGQNRWCNGVYTGQEAAVLGNLTPNTDYFMHVSATNRIGTGHYSWGSVLVHTMPEGEATHYAQDVQELK